MGQESGNQEYSPEKQEEKFKALPPTARLDAVFAVMGEGASPLGRGTILEMAGINIGEIEDEDVKQGIEQRFQSSKIEKKGEELHGLSPEKQQEILAGLEPDIDIAARRRITGYFMSRLMRPRP